METLDKQCISDLNDPKVGYYGEWVYYETLDEREEAFEYLRLWKKFVLKKLRGLKQSMHDQIVERTDIYNNGVNTLGIKIRMIEDNNEK